MLSLMLKGSVNLEMLAMKSPNELLLSICTSHYFDFLPFFFNFFNFFYC